MEKKTRNTIAITALSVIALAGIGWFIYDKIKIKKLNAQLSTPEEMQQKIDDKLSDIPDGPIEDTPVDPDVMPNIEYDDNGEPIDNSAPADYGDTTASDGYDILIVYAKSSARVRSQPNTNSNIVTTASLGDVYFVVGSSQESDGLWYNVDDGSGTSGWMRSDVVTTD